MAFQEFSESYLNISMVPAIFGLNLNETQLLLSAEKSEMALLASKKWSIYIELPKTFCCFWIIIAIFY